MNSDFVLLHGDCLEEMPKIAKTYNDIIVVTDPPYKNYSDKLAPKEYYEMLESVFKYSAFVVIHYPEEIYRIAFHMDELPDKVVSWVYSSIYPSNTVKQHKDIGFFGVEPNFKKYGQPYINLIDKRIAKLTEEGRQARLYDWWEINQIENASKEKTSHSCQIPFEVMNRIIGILPDDYIIVDPFMGSGTTGLACKNLNRKFIGIELDKTCFKIAKNRIEGLTNE